MIYYFALVLLLAVAAWAGPEPADNLHAQITAGGYNRPTVPPIGVTVLPASIDFHAPQAPDLGGLSLGDGDAFEVGSSLFELMRAPSLEIHQPGQFIGIDLLGGRRYLNILPPMATVVSVNVGDNVLMPVHANRINDTTIAAQGPMAVAANQHGIPAFFAAALDQRVQSIVNLTNQADGLKNATVSVEYWPAVGDTRTCVVGSRTIEVTNNGVRQYSGYRIVALSVAEPATNTVRGISIYHFTQWPDHGVPRGEAADQFMLFMDVFERESGSSNTIVHCSAGVGRTGTFIVLRQLLEGIRNGSITRGNLLETIRDRVWEGRVARGWGFVQSPAQMVMLVERGLDEAGVRGGVATDGNDRDTLEATGEAGIGGPVHDMPAMTLSDVEDMLRAGRIVDPQNGNRLVISSEAWVAILNGLSAEELKSLAMFGTSTLRPELGYGPEVLRPVYRAYAEKRFKVFLAKGQSIAQISAFVQNSPNYRPGTMLGQAARDVLTEMVQRSLASSNRSQ